MRSTVTNNDDGVYGVVQRTTVPETTAYYGMLQNITEDNEVLRSNREKSTSKSTSKCYLFGGLAVDCYGAPQTSTEQHGLPGHSAEQCGYSKVENIRLFQFWPFFPFR